MFGFGKKAKAAVAALNKNEHRPLMMAIVAGGVLVAAADGNIEDSELNTLSAVIQNSPTLRDFGAEASDAMNGFIRTITAAPTTGKLEVLRAIEAVRSDRTDAQTVMAAVIDIANANGGVEEKEQAVLTRIANVLGMNLSDFE